MKPRPKWLVAPPRKFRPAGAMMNFAPGSREGSTKLEPAVVSAIEQQFVLSFRHVVVATTEQSGSKAVMAEDLSDAEITEYFWELVEVGGISLQPHVEPGRDGLLFFFKIPSDLLRAVAQA